MDEMVLDAAKQGKGQKLFDNLGDPQFKGMEKWSYGETSAQGLRSEVHYVRDPKTGQLLDLKFKHHAETYK
jgi:filamentous hemagglutinin